MIFDVPQFLDVETKIIGPLSFKGMIYVSGSAAALFGLIWFFNITIGIILAAPIVILGIALAFYRPNNRPFVYRIQIFFRYIFSPKKYRWEMDKVGDPNSELLKDIEAAQKNIPNINKISNTLNVLNNKN